MIGIDLYVQVNAYITYAIPTTIADVIAKKYINAGWNYVYYMVDKEFGYTNFILSIAYPDSSVKFKRYTKLCRK